MATIIVGINAARTGLTLQNQGGTVSQDCSNFETVVTSGESVTWQFPLDITNISFTDNDAPHDLFSSDPARDMVGANNYSGTIKTLENLSGSPTENYTINFSLDGRSMSHDPKIRINSK